MADVGVPENLPEIISGLEVITEATQKTFGSLSSLQLNWKPAPDRWSIAQCFEHLMNTNKSYLPIFQRIANDEKKNTVWESMPFLPRFFGGMLVKSLMPTSARKLKAPGVFAPSSSEIDEKIVWRFIDQQKEMTRSMAALEGKDLDAIRLTSPALKLITYSLRDACRIIVVHEQRHFQQAERLVSETGFPEN
jgi:hypothetical protein